MSLSATVTATTGTFPPMETVSLRSPAPGFYADPALLALPGIERNRAYVRGETGFPAFHFLTGARPTEASMGRSVFSLPATDWLTGSAPIIPGGVLAMLADAPLAGAIESVLPPTKVATTSEISVNLIAPAFPGPGNLVARASVIDVGSQLGFSQAEITDQHGRLVAHATSRCVIVTAPPSEGPQRQVDPDWDPESFVPPWQGEPVGTLYPDLDERAGLDIVRGWIAGELDRPPLSYLFGHRPISAEEGECVWEAPASPWWSSPGPFLYGGALALFAELAHAEAFHTLCTPGWMYANLDLKIQYLRPALPDSGPLTAHGRVTHRGRSIMVADVEVTNSEGKTVLHGTGSAAMIENGLRILYAQRRT